jgi:hypothetical protein
MKQWPDMRRMDAAGRLAASASPMHAGGAWIGAFVADPATVAIGRGGE